MIRQPLRTIAALMNAVRQEAAMGSVYGQRELNIRPGGRKNNRGARSGAGRPPFIPTKEQRRMVSVLAGVGRPHKEIATLVVNPRTGKPIDDANAAAAFPRRIVPLRQGEGRGQRRAWDAGTKPLGLGSVGRDHNGSLSAECQRRYRGRQQDHYRDGAGAKERPR